MASCWAVLLCHLGCAPVDELRPPVGEVGTGGTGTGGGQVATSTTSGSGGAGENCTNGKDDDGDGLIDCADAECANLWLCPKDGSEWVQIDGGQLLHPTAGVPSPIIDLVFNASGDLLAGTFTSGVWRTKDLGKHWEQLPVASDPNVRLFRLAVDAQGNVFAGVEGRAYPDQLAKVYRSTDGGDTWKLVAASFADGGNPALKPQVTAAFTFPKPGVVVAGTGWLPQLSAVFVSLDGGDTWSNTPYAGPKVKSSVIMGLGTTPSGAILSGSEGYGTNRSLDLGKTWKSVQGSLTTATQTWQFVFKGTIGYAAAQGYPEGGVHKSADDGVTWVRLGPPPAKATGFMRLTVTDSGYIAAGTIDEGAFESSDGGANWKAITAIPSPRVHAVVSDAGGYVYLGTQGKQNVANAGIYRSTKPR
jgi:photosystem II stability/assembly factor-like uncharacterized protein